MWRAFSGETMGFWRTVSRTNQSMTLGSFWSMAKACASVIEGVSMSCTW
jgi:hypothetical protein